MLTCRLIRQHTLAELRRHVQHHQMQVIQAIINLLAACVAFYMLDQLDNEHHCCN